MIVRFRTVHTQSEGSFPLAVTAFFVLLGMPFLNITPVLTIAAILCV